MSRASLLDLVPEMQPAATQLYNICVQAGANPTITSTLRTYAEQAALYDDYIAGRSKYPADKPGTSAHEFGYAFDMSMPWPGDEVQAGQVWVGWGGVYGGARDPVHFEFGGWRTLRTQTAATSGPNLPASFGTPSTASWDQLADLLIAYISPLGIFGRVAVATALGQIFGVPGAQLVAFYLSHPVEFVRDVYGEWWTLLSLLYG